MFANKTIRINGVAYTLSKLSPNLFLGEEYFPLNNFIEKAEPKISDVAKETDALKALMKKTIEKSLVKVRQGFSKIETGFAIKSIMKNAELYSYLFSEIIRLSFGIKKKTKYLFT